ncbi:MAG TPA: bacillithiol biosynthesis deacetylase BshB1 [Candidatus Xenobia bacterium]|nr:bacillithiol biosynthesis deacetylase BshB1 [Candidatus Xenobia bacterium]
MKPSGVDLLAIVAHPDDAELACGGTLAGAVRRGYRVGVLDLTRGEMGTRGTPEQRAREARAATRALGLHHRENLGLPDSALEPDRTTLHEVAARLRALRPRVVILPYWKGRHPDHVAASHIGYKACYLAGLAKLDLGLPPHRPTKVLYSLLFDLGKQAAPSFIVDITRDYKRRARAIACYRSQFDAPKMQRGIHIPLTGLEERLDAICRYYGSLVGVRYGEPFLTRELMPVDDVLQLPGRSL